MPQLKDSTRQFQSSLAGYCRTGVYEAIPGVRDAHVGQYRRLVYNVIDDMLQSAYPITHDLLAGAAWDNLVQDFFTGHPCQSPQVWYMPKELPEYLVAKKHPLTRQYPFLTDLLWFEWMEIAVFMMEDKNTICRKDGDPFTSRLVLNPEYQLLELQYPVHIKKGNNITMADKGHYHLIVFRSPDTGEVHFFELSPLLKIIVEELANDPVSIQELVNELIEDESQKEGLSRLLLSFVNHSLQTGLISGYKM